MIFNSTFYSKLQHSAPDRSSEWHFHFCGIDKLITLAHAFYFIFGFKDMLYYAQTLFDLHTWIVLEITLWLNTPAGMCNALSKLSGISNGLSYQWVSLEQNVKKFTSFVKMEVIPLANNSAVLYSAFKCQMNIYIPSYHRI